MGIKTEVNKERVGMTTPLLMKDKSSTDPFVILVTEIINIKCRGTVITENQHWKVGDRYDSWDINEFEIFDGEVILSNK